MSLMIIFLSCTLGMHRILMVRPDRRTFSSCAPTRELIEYSSVTHHSVTPTINFLSFNFLSLPADSKSDKTCDHRGYCTSFTQAELWRKSCAKDKKNCFATLQPKSTSFDSLIRHVRREPLSGKEAHIINRCSKEQGRSCLHWELPDFESVEKILRKAI